MSKLILNEEEDIIVTPNDIKTDAIEEIEEKPEVNILSASNLINQMIKGEWDAIDLYNAVIVTIENDPEAKHKEEIIETIKDITNEEYIHVGQLQKLLQVINGSALNIEDGKQEAEQDLAA